MSAEPPRLARCLLVLIPQPDREFIEGDLEEEYADRVLLSRTRADAWYWHQVLASLPPIGVAAALEWLRNAVPHTAPHRRTLAMASPTARPSSTVKPAFGHILLASRPGRDRSQLATTLMSAILHGGIVGGFVLGTMGAGPDWIYDEVQMIEYSHELTAAPPPPPPAVEAPAAMSSLPMSLTLPDQIPTGIPAPGSAITAEDIYLWAIEAARDTTRNRSGEVVPIGTTPSFTPFTVAPAMQNREEVGRALEREYPSLLRDAGVGGRVEVWIRLDDRGLVQDAQVNVSSGQSALDDAALRVARIIAFTPAMNRDKAVPVWVSIPITFQVR